VDSTVIRSDVGLQRERQEFMDLMGSIDLLDGLATGEFHAGIAAVLDDPDEYLAFKRLGRLAALSIKTPFAVSREYDPTLSINWAKSSRQWGIVTPPSEADIAAHRHEYDLLVTVAREWNKPIWSLAEYNIFSSLCRWTTPVLCGESEAFKKAAEAAEELRKDGGSASVLTPSSLITWGAAQVATELAATVPQFAEHTPTVTTFALILAFYGHSKACAYLKRFLASYRANLDHS
jgi:hypothetical protein